MRKRIMLAVAVMALAIVPTGERRGSRKSSCLDGKTLDLFRSSRQTHRS
jgi:hypothetical protein